MDVIMSTVKLNLLAPIGSISKIKSSMLDNMLLGDFPEKQQPIDHTVIYLNLQKGSSVIIGPNQISFGIENIDKQISITENRSYVDETISSWKTMAKAITKELLLDELCDIVEVDFAAFVSTQKNKGKEAADNSIQNFSPIKRPALRGIGDPIAVGLRYVFERELMIFDTRIEPFLPNLSQYFYTMNAKTKPTKKTFDEAFVILENNYNFFNGQLFTLIKDSILI